MPRECQKRPELHQPALDFISKVNQGHQTGTAAIGLIDTIRLFGAALSPQDEASLRQRGNLMFTRVSQSGGTFQNQGTAMSMVQNGITITVPVEVSGTYTSFTDSLHLNFDQSHTIVGRLLFLFVKLEDISVDQNRIDIDLSGDAFDQCFIHSPVA